MSTQCGHRANRKRVTTKRQVGRQTYASQWKLTVQPLLNEAPHIAALVSIDDEQASVAGQQRVGRGVRQGCHRRNPSHTQIVIVKFPAPSTCLQQGCVWSLPPVVRIHPFSSASFVHVVDPVL